MFDKLTSHGLNSAAAKSLQPFGASFLASATVPSDSTASSTNSTRALLATLLEQTQKSEQANEALLKLNEQPSRANPNRAPLDKSLVSAVNGL